MSILYEYKKRARQLVGPILLACLISYFVYHTVHGDRGILTWVRLSQQIADAEATLKEEQTRHDALEHQVIRLRPDSLDPDLLEERARIMADMVRPDDVIVIYDERDFDK
jgi:cell division protein FtsB